MPDTLIDALKWESYPVPATLASPSIGLSIGRAGTGKPVGVLVAGQHGDEGPWGTRAIMRFLEATPLADLRGSLRVVPVANPLAYEENSRTAHIDGDDVNMEFPGDAHGKHTPRLAAILREHAVDGADVVLDVHGGGSWCVNCFVYRFPNAHDVAAAIGAPFVRDGPERGTTSLTGYALSIGAKAAWIEVGGAGQNEERWAELVAGGLRRALALAGVVSPEAGPALAEESRLLSGPATSLRTSAPGLYHPTLREDDVGRLVARGTEIGRLIDPLTLRIVETYTAPYDETAVILLRPTIAVMEGGEMVCVLSAL
jgi:predicted deacylase